MRSFVATVLTCFACGLVLVGALNGVVDPFGVLPAPEIDGLNVPKTEISQRSRLHQAHAPRWRRPTAVILGSSTSIIGLDPAHPGWQSPRPYNLSLPGASAYHMRRYLEHALAIGPLDRVVVGLDFASFNAYFRFDADWDEERFFVAPDGRPSFGRPLEPLEVTLSMDALRASVNTIWKNERGTIGTVCGPDGRCWMRGEGEVVRGEHGMRRVFESFEKGFLWQFWFPPPARVYRFTDPQTGRSTFDELREIVRIAHRSGIDLALVVSPTHVQLYEACLAVGLGDLFEEWERMLTRVVAEEAGADRRIRLWDFSDYHPLTAEEFPAAAGATMRWYLDSVHYRKELGDLVLDRVFDHREPGREVPTDFGVELSQANVEEHLARRREAHERYRASHAADVAEIESWARRANEERRLRRARR